MNKHRALKVLSLILLVASWHAAQSIAYASIIQDVDKQDVDKKEGQILCPVRA